MKEDVKKKRFFPPLGKMRMWTQIEKLEKCDFETSCVGKHRHKAVTWLTHETITVEQKMLSIGRIKEWKRSTSNNVVHNQNENSKPNRLPCGLSPQMIESCNDPPCDGERCYASQQSYASLEQFRRQRWLP